VVERLGQLGISITPDHALTSAEAAPRWLKRTMPELKRVYMVGEQALADSLQEQGIELVEQNADAVVVGLDRTVTYDKLKRATLEIRRGAKFIATNTDRTLPTEEGLTPGAGSLIAALVAATDTEPILIGKPGRPMFDIALELAGTSARETAMLGDRLDTDIDGAAAAGLKTIMVLTGVSTRAEAERNSVKPDCLVEDLHALARIWAAALE
jgi:4-nitrophenyl phosphatase